MLTSVAHAKKLDDINDNDLLMDSINGQIENLNVTFDFLENCTNIPVGDNKASSHLVFDVFMTLEWKARW